MRIEVEQSGFGGGMVTELGIPIQFKLEPGQVDPEIPQLGEHTHEVLGALGLSTEEVVQASGLAPREVP
jgi:crotonobetainyl-CoA:carnitine CoA-transferase CaiB-like acyl-CoA transferase